MSVRITPTITFSEDNLKPMLDSLSGIARLESLTLETGIPNIYTARFSFDSDHTATFLNTVARSEASLISVSDEPNPTPKKPHAIASKTTAIEKVKETPPPRSWKGGKQRRKIARLRHAKGKTVKDAIRDFTKTKWRTYEEIQKHIGSDVTGIRARMHELKVDEKGLESKVRASDNVTLYRYSTAKK